MAVQCCLPHFRTYSLRLSVLQVRRPESLDARAFGELRDMSMVLLAVVVKVFRTGVIVERDALERPPTPKDPWTLPQQMRPF